ncbi:hypothetical protein ACUNWD_08690 [Sunxiuqinia sp. A32]|uniref:hypothetical protein n=1 Tax=Sunxiuqinia sp. A32 TaxID=3461496 RepID=UPI0040462B61
MTKVVYRKEKIGSSYLVWLEQSNKYFQLEELAWFVFSRLANGDGIDQTTKVFSDSYGFEKQESSVFVKEMHERISEMNRKEKPEIEEQIDLEVLRDYSFKPYSNYHYQFGQRVVDFVYGSEWVEDYLHPLICHLVVTDVKAEPLLFELFSFQDKVVLRLNNEIKGVWGWDESHLTKGCIFLELSNVLHGRYNDDWLMTVHASAITNGKKTILFSAAPGSGKTTMAALLQANGFHLISDDFVPFDKLSMNAYPFPIAMSVKEGAMDLLKTFYQGIENKPLVKVSPDKNVRYVPIVNELMEMVYPVAEIIFIKYDSSVDFSLEKLDQIFAIKEFLEQIWVPPVPENIEILFNLLSHLNFYQLTYSNNERAIDAVKQLFDNDKY